MTEEVNAVRHSLLDTGPSERGWHYYERFLRCSMIYYWRRRDDAALAEATANGTVIVPKIALALARGTIGHVGLAHFYARQRAIQRGEDPSAILSPREAMIARADSLGRIDLLPEVSETVRGYIEHYGYEQAAVLGVERPVETLMMVGTHAARYTARIDLVWRDKLGAWIVDHKFVGRIEKKTIRRYTLSGQFLGLQVLGERLIPNFAGVVLNLVGFDGGFYRQQLDPAPWMLDNFPALIVAADARMKVIEKRAQEIGVAAVSALYAAHAVPSEMTCYTPYGECEYFERCRWGK